jgi:hypothetical protein
MRRACKVDNNHGEIRDKLRDAGYWIVDTHDQAHGYPDLTVILPGAVALLEIKQPGERLTGDEQAFHAHAEAIGAPVFVVRSVEEALVRLGEVMRK